MYQDFLFLCLNSTPPYEYAILHSTIDGYCVVTIVLLLIKKVTLYILVQGWANVFSIFLSINFAVELLGFVLSPHLAARLFARADVPFLHSC